MSTAASSGRKRSTSTENNKKSGADHATRRTSSQSGQADHFSQARIKELEQQVSDLKRRLDELRKAKNTTIIKKDKAYVTSGEPRYVHDSTPKGTSDLITDRHRKGTSSLEATVNTKVERSDQELKDQQDNITALKEMHRAELEELRKEVEKQAKQADSNMAAEVEMVKKQNRELQDENEELKSKTTELQLRVEDLLEELSKKEAEWCSKEEKLTLEVKTSWGERYQKWMAQTEQKIEELQTANDFLKSLLEKERLDRS